MRRSYNPKAGSKQKPLGSGMRSNVSRGKTVSNRNRSTGGSRLRTKVAKAPGLTRYR